MNVMDTGFHLSKCSDTLVDLVQTLEFGTLVEAGLLGKKKVGPLGARKENSTR